MLGTIAASAFEAAKSLGEYGTRVKDAELRTGLTAKEVGQFGFAARAVGQDISSPGAGERLISPEPGHLGKAGAVQRRQRLGGTLNYYYRAAA